MNLKTRIACALIAALLGIVTISPALHASGDSTPAASQTEAPADGNGTEEGPTMPHYWEKKRSFGCAFFSQAECRPGRTQPLAAGWSDRRAHIQAWMWFSPSFSRVESSLARAVTPPGAFP